MTAILNENEAKQDEEKDAQTSFILVEDYFL